MINVESSAPAGFDTASLTARAIWTCERLGITTASVGLMVVDPERMAEINGAHRDRPRPTDVLSFPIDGPEALTWDGDGPPPELGDVIICPEAAEEPLETLVVHGILHLLGYDHETDDGEMLALQDRLTAEAQEAGR